MPPLTVRAQFPTVKDLDFGLYLVMDWAAAHAAPVGD